MTIMDTEMYSRTDNVKRSNDIKAFNFAHKRKRKECLKSSFALGMVNLFIFYQTMHFKTFELLKVIKLNTGCLFSPK